MPVLYRFDRLPGPIALADPDLLEPLAGRLCGWDISPWPAETPTPRPVVAIAREGAGFVLRGRDVAGAEVYRDVGDLVCSALVEMIAAYGDVRRDLMMIHAGGAVIGGKLVLFPAASKAGKSTLTAQLAARGARIYSDDVVGGRLDTGEAEAFGIEPRLRLPLSRRLSPATRAWIAERKVLDNGGICYLHLPRSGPGALAARGEAAPVAALVALERAQGADPALTPLARNEVMKLLIVQHFRTAAPTPEVVARLKDMVERAACYRLRYDRGEHAADLLQEMAEAA